jgi:transcriptional regulator with XRE-family HTH domain
MDTGKTANNLPHQDIKIGSRIAALRKGKGLTQAQLAEQIGISRLLLSDYERGKVRLYADVVARVANALGVSTEQILMNQSINDTDYVPSLRLVKRLQKIEKLPAAEQKALLKNIDMFLKASESE